MIVLIDTERGARSVQHLVDAGSVEVVKANRFSDAEQVFWDIARGKRTNATGVIVDSITSLATTTRQDLVVDPEKAGDSGLWVNRSSLVAAQRDWGNMSDLIGRLLRHFRNQLDIPIVVICHEGEREDVSTGLDKKGPDLNAALLKEVVHFSDTMMRLSVLSQPIKVGDKDYKSGTRVLRFAGNDQFMAKVRIPGNLPAPPEILPEPNSESITKILGGLPHTIVLYGASGAGKTTLACELLTSQKHNQKGK